MLRKIQAKAQGASMPSEDRPILELSVVHDGELVATRLFTVAEVRSLCLRAVLSYH
jgi:hypothetical protein